MELLNALADHRVPFGIALAELAERLRHVSADSSGCESQPVVASGAMGKVGLAKLTASLLRV
jgi:hypothetical protein